MLLLLAGWVPAAASPATAGVLLPGPASVAGNPAYAAYPQQGWSLTGTPLPVGLLGLLRPESNPFLYLTDRDRFRSFFDLLSFYEQLTHPTPPGQEDRLEVEAAVAAGDPLYEVIASGSFRVGVRVVLSGSALGLVRVSYGIEALTVMVEGYPFRLIP